MIRGMCGCVGGMVCMLGDSVNSIRQNKTITISAKFEANFMKYWLR